MDDIFYDDGAERAIHQNEMARLQAEFKTLGLKDGIINKKHDYDQEILNQAFKEGFNDNLRRGYFGGKIDALTYIIINTLTLDKQVEDAFVQKLNNIKDNLKGLDADW
eukprot:CAMPEP_0176406802 /NCGR_PEP_ID=MMETSP0127-20121128/1072_1 /TAXON_ID=938130 /ORGANISM="Platyophrya macrostoma, Strain WH" /LENGTH=107 /DNA_ID=CAMNT_0017785965 /DNA_START=22 /DNA_END=342 /DNA_ORIENTATION=-